MGTWWAEHRGAPLMEGAPRCFSSAVRQRVLNSLIRLTEAYAGDSEFGLVEISKSLALGASPARQKHRVPHAQQFAYFQDVDSPTLDSNATPSSQEIEMPAVDPAFRPNYPWVSRSIIPPSTIFGRNEGGGVIL